MDEVIKAVGTKSWGSSYVQIGCKGRNGEKEIGDLD